MIRELKNIAHSIEAKAAGLFYRSPGKKIYTIGVTGTDGKTTTSSLIFHILKTAGFNTSVITTVGAQIADQEYETGLHTTTPSAFFLQKYIRKALGAGSEYLVLEITSHALDQNRVSEIDFKIGVLTNITHEHLDYHKTYDEYIKAKSKLFKKSEVSVINMDDKSYHVIREIIPPNKKILTYSVANAKANFTLKSIGIKLPSEFEFNQQNFLAALVVAKFLKIDDEKIKLGVATFKFPQGRQEIVYEENFLIIIDFAHTPNSFDKILPELKKTTPGRLIHVFGAAGKRDKSKRPLMGLIASKFDDVIILTAEDPRSEKVEDINSQIKIEIKDYKGELIEIEDRQKAIDHAVQIARKGDTVLITGKGHEKSINLGKGEIPWSEHAAVDTAIKSKKTA